jgi:hypothetical protein
MSLTQVSELKDEGVPEDPRGLLHPLPDLGLTQVSELNNEGYPEPEDPHRLLQPPLRFGPHPGE